MHVAQKTMCYYVNEIYGKNEYNFGKLSVTLKVAMEKQQMAYESFETMAKTDMRK